MQTNFSAAYLMLLTKVVVAPVGLMMSIVIGITSQHMGKKSNIIITLAVNKE